MSGGAEVAAGHARRRKARGDGESQAGLAGRRVPAAVGRRLVVPLRRGSGGPTEYRPRLRRRACQCFSGE